MQIRSVGIDLGKTTFNLVALRDNGKILRKKKFTQKQLVTFTSNMQTCLIGMEAFSVCSSALTTLSLGIPSSISPWAAIDLFKMKDCHPFGLALCCLLDQTSLAVQRRTIHFR